MATDRQLKAKTIKNDAAVVTLPTATSTVATRELSETLSLKTLAAPVLSTFGEFTEQGSAPATPSAGALRLYAKSSNSKLFTKNSAGVETEVGSGSGGAGGVNYIASTDAETGTVGWATYADAAGVIPVNGTGGSATVTWTTTTTTPLRGLSSFLFTKDAANRQGEGVSYDFTIDRADVNKVIKIAFDYTVSSGTFVAGSSSDVRVFIYDVTNSQLIYPVDFKLNSTSVDSFQGTFQTTSSLSYRLIFHVATTSASAYVLKIDNVQVGPQSALYGAVVTEVTDYSALVSVPACYGTATDVEYYGQRVGDMFHARGVFQCGTTTGADATWFLPPGMSVDSAKFTQNVTDPTRDGRHFVGTAYALLSAGAALDAGPLLAIFYDKELGGLYLTNQTEATREFDVRAASGFVNTSEVLSFSFSVPIQGWGSAVQMSDASDTRVTAARYTSESGQSIPNATVTIVDYATKDYDTHGLVTTGGSWTFTATQPGYYRVTARVGWSTISTTNTYITSLYKNGAFYSGVAAQGDNSTVLHADTIKLLPGDFIDIRTSQDTGGSVALEAGAGNNSISVERVSGPSAIAANELVAVHATLTADQSVPDTNTDIVVFDNTSTNGGFDTHGSFNTATGRFTAPASGTYQFSPSLLFATGYASLDATIYKNGSPYKLIMVSTGGISRADITSSILMHLIPGDIIDIRVTNSSGGAALVNGDTNQEASSVSIHRIGF